MTAAGKFNLNCKVIELDFDFAAGKSLVPSTTAANVNSSMTGKWHVRFFFDFVN